MIMKMTFRHILANLAAVVALSSCTKEVTEPVEPVIGGGERVISATFGPVSKSTLGTDGLKPVFTDGDLITVTNGTATQICTLSVNGSVSTFRTTLAGPLKAVYPKDAAVVSNNDITGVKVLSEQTGLFKDANIAKADIPASSISAVFHIQTAVLRFYVDASIKVKNITITGSLDIASEGSNKKQIVVDPDDALINTKTGGNPDPRLCYVAVLPNTAANTLTFTSDTDTQGTVTRTTTATLKTAGMYNAFIPYYITIGTQKWGYCNVGAFLPEDYGLYFGWGDLVGQTWNGSAWSGGGFGWSRDPANEGNSTYNAEAFNRQKATVCPGNVLALAYDTAYNKWGTDWRMPTGGTNAATSDFQVLCNNTNHSCKTDHNVKGWKFTDKSNSNNSIFLPIAGLSESGTDYKYNQTHANYWASTLYSNPQEALWLHLMENKVETNSHVNRVRGGSIRPIYDDITPSDFDPYGEGGTIFN